MSKLPISEVVNVQWCCLSREQWRAISVVNVTRPSSKDGGGDNDRTNTPYDPRLGEQRNRVPCGTCNKPNTQCPGHFGTIELPFPVYNKLFSTIVLKILQSVCKNCSRPRLLPEYIKMQGFTKLCGFARLKMIVSKSHKLVKQCPWKDCGEAMVQFDGPNKKKSETGVIYYSVASDGLVKREEFTAGAAFSVLSRISDEHLELLGFNNNLLNQDEYTDSQYFLSEEFKHVHQFRPESMIFTVFPVLPSLSRPWVVSEQDDGERKDDDLTDKYNSLLKHIILYNSFDIDGVKTETKSGTASKRGNSKTKNDVARDIIDCVWTLGDNKSEKSKLSSGGRAHRSIVCRLKGKFGRIHGNVGGKRVDFSARTVIIGGGILLKDDELGVPNDIASVLTKPEFVGPWNIDYCQSLVGDSLVNCVLRNGSKTKLTEFPDHGRHFQLRNGDICERQLQDGDIVLFNRQPTLRIESMMAFRVKIVDGMAFQLGLCWTASFNADFDGDEMNLHVPQSVEAEVEIMVNSRCALHIVSSQRNGPVNGAVQDALVGAYMLTNHWEDGTLTMVPRNVVKIVYEGSEIPQSRITDLIVRGKKYYPEYISKDGKDFTESIPGSFFISILFPSNFCYTRNTENHIDPKYHEVKIDDGIILPDSGPLCKKTIGSKNGSIVHVLWKRAPEFALKFLSDLQQCTDRWLPNHGFSMGISDCFASRSHDVAKTLIETRQKVDHILKSTETLEQAEQEINSVLNSAMAVGPSLAKGSMQNGDRNALNVMRNSGAKGSLINLAQIVAFVGQQNIKGQRMPCQLSHGTRCLPSFLPGDNSPDARGFVEDNYIRGLTPQAAFFHAGAGRDGIISTSLKSVTGETPIIIFDGKTTKIVLIGDWIDGLFFVDSSNVQNYKEREMQLLNIEKYKIFIPTTDEKGQVSWGLIKNVTRHDPGKRLFRIKTLEGRDVVVTESKSLLIWKSDEKRFVRCDSDKVKIGDFVPTTLNLPSVSSSLENYFEPNHENGIFIGLFLGSGKYSNTNIEFQTESPTIQKFLTEWFEKNKIQCVKENGIKAECGLLVESLKSLVGEDADFIPNVSFSTPNEFISGVIGGYFSVTGFISENEIEMISTSSKLIVGMNILLSKLGIFGRLSKFDIFGRHTFSLKIRDKWVVEFSNKIKPIGVNFSLNNVRLFPEIFSSVIQNDVVLDSIVSIEELTIESYHQNFPQYNGKVYDLTVPSTLNFGLANGLHVVDTADTGYLQKRIARKLEDLRVWIDGTVRDANGRIVSFLYGDDGMESKKLVAVKGLESPFFINPMFLARQLNSDARRSGEVNDTEKPRKLREVEIDLLLSFIHLSKISSPVLKLATKNAQSTLREIIDRIEIYESKIPDLCVGIRDAYNSSKAQYGTMVGLLATSAIGEPTTQMVLNSVEYDTELILKVKQKGTFVIKIGDWIDSIMNNGIVQIINQNGKCSEYVKLSSHFNVSIPTVSEDGIVFWGEITAVTRHPPHGDMVKITTRSGRSVTATKSKSLLIWNEKTMKFEQTPGSNVKIGDLVPMTENFPKTKEHVKTAIIKTKKDTFVVDLNEETGFAVGVFLTERYCVSVLDVEVKLRLKSWLQKYDKNATEIYNSFVMKTWIDNRIPRESYGASLDFAQGILDGFISAKGFISDGFETENGETAVIIASSPKLKLLEDIGVLCTRFGISTNISSFSQNLTHPPEMGLPVTMYTLNISKRKAFIFFTRIGLTNAYKKESLRSVICQEKITTKNGQSYNDVVFDPIISIEIIPEKLHPKVYDLTIPSTTNFCIHNGMGCADTFHLAGFGGKDASLGVPRFKELINTTKSTDQRHPGCVIYFDYPMIKQNAETVIELEKENRKTDEKQREINNVIIKRAKEDSLSLLQSLQKDFEETYVGDFVTNYEMKYLPEEVDIETEASPLRLLTYEEYEEEWWVTLSRKIGNTPKDSKPESWVIILHFDMEKLFRRRIEVEDIAISLEEKSNGDMKCVTSPNILGRIEVYTTLSNLKAYTQTKIDLPKNSKSERSELLTDENVDYFLCREVAIDFIKKTQVTGISGISKIYPREDMETHEWVMDTDGANYLEILTMVGVDSTRTKVDDMHSVNSVLGIEAARRFLFDELKRVISFDGTYINPRHLSMLSDSMTVNGSLTAASRDGIGRDVGPNAKVMFEKSVDNAMMASAFGEIDDMTSLSSSVMYGKLAYAGPGMVSVRNKERVPVKPPNVNKETIIKRRAKSN